MKKLYLSLTLALLIISAGCMTRITDFTIISSKNIDLSKASTFKRTSDRVKGEDRMWIIIFFPTKFKIDLKAAIDEAIQSVPGCVALVDGVVSAESWYFLIGTDAYMVEGTPLIDPSLTSIESFSKYNMCVLDENGKVKEFKELTKEQFEKEKAKF
jgi:hypothetical protein